jgi:hypothetical protein
LPLGDLNDASVMHRAAVVTACSADLVLGLTGAEAERRLLAQGPNELRAAAKVAPWRRWLAQLQDPLVRAKPC